MTVVLISVHNKTKKWTEYWVIDDIGDEYRLGAISDIAMETLDERAIEWMKSKILDRLYYDIILEFETVTPKEMKL